MHIILAYLQIKQHFNPKKALKTENVISLKMEPKRYCHIKKNFFS